MQTIEIFIERCRAGLLLCCAACLLLLSLLAGSSNCTNLKEADNVEPTSESLSRCSFPGDTGFATALEKGRLPFLMADDVEPFQYAGIKDQPSEAAERLHDELNCAIQLEERFSEFANTGKVVNGLHLDTVEALALLAHAKVETRGFTVVEEEALSRHCTPRDDFPCAENGASYHDRGPLRIRGNLEYGQLSEFLFNDKQKLLENPNLITSDRVTGWKAALWKWMTKREFGVECPTNPRVGHGSISCHSAITDYDQPAKETGSAKEGNLRTGFGLTLNLLGRAGDCCPQTLVTDLKRLPTKQQELVPRRKMKLRPTNPWALYPEDQMDREIAQLFSFSQGRSRVENGKLYFDTATLISSSSSSSASSSQAATNPSDQPSHVFDLSSRLASFLTFILRLGLRKDKGDMFLPGHPNCKENDEEDPDNFCVLLTSSCPALHDGSTVDQNANCSPVCTSTAIVVNVPGALRMAKVPPCWLQCDEQTASD